MAAVDLLATVKYSSSCSSIQHHWYHWRAVEAPPRHPIAARSRGAKRSFDSRRTAVRNFVSADVDSARDQGTKLGVNGHQGTIIRRSIDSYNAIERWRRLTIFGLVMGTEQQQAPGASNE